MVEDGLDLRAALERRADAAVVAAIGYFLLSTLAIALTGPGHAHAAIWPADALILVLLLRESRSAWAWAWVLGAGWVANLAANVLARDWSPILIAYGAINMGQTALAAWLMLRHYIPGPTLDHDLSIKPFALRAIAVAVAVGALLGSLVTSLAFGEPFVASLLRWYCSNALGLLILTPFLAAVLDGSYLKWLRLAGLRERLHAALACGGLMAASVLVFAQPHVPLLFVPICGVTWMTFRFGRLATMLGVIIVSLVALATTLSGRGPVAVMPEPSEVQSLFLQFYLGAILLTCLPIAALVASRKQAVIRLAEREEALLQTLQDAPMACLGFDRTGACKWVQGPVRSLLGYTAQEIIGRSWESLCLEIDGVVQELSKAPVADQERSTRTIEFSPIRRPQLRLQGIVGLLASDGGGHGGAVITLRDVTERRVAEPSQASPEQSDELTGLFNGPAFREQLSEAVRLPSGPVSLALIDLDSFYTINEAHGYAIGDAVLVEVARRIRRAARDSDVLARMGSDEFALLLHCDLNTARGICERIVEAVRHSPVYRSNTVSVLSSLSCGIVRLRPGQRGEDALAAAHDVLQEMKQAGRNGVRVAA
ncbi:sensor domain-containing diguanylate cyclase [Novosphingobium decolorationis]|uniref:Diguanylate cyclase n=1 Tax=Novosphingobium decolorationis TaxID=2698673 RepID=A0ABX8E3H6_9SPHN|nr:diguanylate cyclase [Novosphingobium decolorationis]QVM83731.1 diguanylate cyclase [Novosphingobium decolorationis]